MVSGHEAASVVATYLQAAQTPPSMAVGPVAAPKPPTATGPAAADGVTLSDAPQQVARWLAMLRQLPDVRADRVAEVRSRLHSGGQPASREVARQILRRTVADRLGAQL